MECRKKSALSGPMDSSELLNEAYNFLFFSKIDFFLFKVLSISDLKNTSIE